MSDDSPISTVPVHEGLFSIAADGTPRLIGGLCASCHRHHFPLLTTCPYCSAQAVSETLLSAAGSLWGWTAVTTAPPGYRGEVPFGFGVVELPEGLRVITRLTEPTPERLEQGQPMRLVVAPLHVDDEGRSVVTYAFAPAGDPS
jgi:uncharacterized OB-fold protein